MPTVDQLLDKHKQNFEEKKRQKEMLRGKPPETKSDL